MRRETKLKQLALVLGLVCVALTLAGAGYALLSHGRGNPGYALIPLIFALVCLSVYRQKR